MMQVTTAGEDILISLDGAFDAFAAWQLRGRLLDLPASANVVLDFSDVHEFFDLGVAVMAHGLASADRPHVTMRGLGDHQYKLFRYFGVDQAALALGAAAP